MKTTIRTRNILFPARDLAAPEFRAAHKKFSTAYSGPEQRNRTPHHLTDRRQPRDAAESPRPNTAAA